MTDFVVMVKNNSYMFLTGPKVVKSVTHEDVTVEELGGADMHSSRSGVSDFAAETGADAIAYIRKLVSFLPQNNMEDPPLLPTDQPWDEPAPELDDLVPKDPSKPYDIKELITGVVDQGDFMEVQPRHAQNIICGFAHSRDLIYVSSLVRAYHTPDKIFETLMLAEKCGINTILTHPSIADAINLYKKRYGGKIQFLADCGWIEGTQAETLCAIREALCRARHLASIARQRDRYQPQTAASEAICREILGAYAEPWFSDKPDP